MQPRSNLARGVLALSVAGILSKLIGVFHRLILTAIIGHAGNSYITVTWNVYVLVLTLTSYGFPTAIARLIATRGEAVSTLRISRKLLALLGAAAMGLLMLGGVVYGASYGQGAQLTFFALAPAAFFAALLSAYRGYFQGQRNMTPTAVSQLVEQLAKFLFGIPLAYALMRFAQTDAQRALYGACGVLIGTSLSELGALVPMHILYCRRKGEAPPQPRVLDAAPTSVWRQMWELLRMATPILLAASVMPLIQTIDQFTVLWRLRSIGYAKEAALALFGYANNVINPLLNVPAAFTSALAAAMVPAIAAALAQNDRARQQSLVQTGMKLALLIGLPCVAGLCLLAGPIIRLVQPSLSPGEQGMSASLLFSSGISVLFLSVLQVTNGILQGFGKPRIPIQSLLIAGVVKVLVNFILVGIPSINIFGSPIGTLLCYAVASGVNLYHIRRLTQHRVIERRHLLRPLCATGIMAVFVFLFLLIAHGVNAVQTLVCVLLAVFVYGLAALALRCLSRRELEALPGGKVLLRGIAWIRRRGKRVS